MELWRSLWSSYRPLAQVVRSALLFFGVSYAHPRRILARSCLEYLGCRALLRRPQ